MSDDRLCYATMRGTRLSLNDDLECFVDGESLVIMPESEYERLKERQIPDEIDVTDGLAWISTELSSISSVLDKAGLRSLSRKALEIGAAILKLRERVVVARKER